MISSTKHNGTQCKWANRQVEEHLVGSSKAQAFVRAVIEPVHRLIDLLASHPEQAALLGEELAQQTVGVLMETTLPGAKGCAKYTRASRHRPMNACPANSLPLSKVKVLQACLWGRSESTIVGVTLALCLDASG